MKPMRTLELNEDQLLLLEYSVSLFLESIEASEVVLRKLLEDRTELDQATLESVEEELGQVEFIFSELRPVIEKIHNSVPLESEEIHTITELPGTPKWKREPDIER